MPYLSEEDTANLFRDCAELLYKGGIFYFSTIKGEYKNSGYEVASTGDQCYVYYYEETYLHHLLQLNHFQLLDLQYKDFAKADGIVTTDIIWYCPENVNGRTTRVFCYAG